MRRHKIEIILVVLIVLVIGVWAYLFLPGMLATEMYPLPDQYKQALIGYSKQYNVDPCLLAGLIYRESGFNVSSQSGAGALGMTQFMPSTAASLAARIGIPNFSPSQLLSDPDLSIHLGAAYVSELIQRNGGNVEDALLAYNGGQAQVQIKYAGLISVSKPYADAVQGAAGMYCNTYPELHQAAAQPAPAPAAATSAATAQPQKPNLNQLLIQWLTGT